MADRTALRDGPNPAHHDPRLRPRVPVRSLAAIWWIVMVFATACTIGAWIALLVHPAVGQLIALSVCTAIFFTPIAKEWPHWRRMLSMLSTGA